MGRRCLIVFCCALLLLAVGRWAVYYIGAVPFAHVPLEPGNVVVPTERSNAWKSRSALTDRIVEHWANHSLGDSKYDGKIGAPRALTGRFLLKRDLDAANE